MKKTAIIYSFNTVKSAKIAAKIKDAFGDERIDMLNTEEINADKLLEYDNLIVGVPTWFDGELPNYWDEFLPDLEDHDMKSKTFAIFGLGDQKGYSENFVDGMGIMADFLNERGAKIVGYTSAEDYNFEGSRAFRDGKFCGLAIDYENQASKNKERINAWVEQLKNELN
ncbi:MAG TPA: flavodoxin [Bacteroidales bacterium]|nr:flavodoxin [Bacteroidales bacterium]